MILAMVSSDKNEALLTDGGHTMTAGMPKEQTTRTQKSFPD
jgi:hypothetical protein